jgi:PIN domain nuclease of toxin-antitoxin system
MNSYLIDTHVLLWYIEGNPRLSSKIISLLDNPTNTVYVSKASLWEITIKISIGKLSINIPFETLEDFLEEKDFIPLEFDISDLTILKNLPFHHSDPFDRLIIAQAMNNDFTLISDDSKFDPYPVNLLRA